MVNVRSCGTSHAFMPIVLEAMDRLASPFENLSREDQNTQFWSSRDFFFFFFPTLIEYVTFFGQEIIAVGVETKIQVFDILKNMLPLMYCDDTLKEISPLKSVWPHYKDTLVLQHYIDSKNPVRFLQDLSLNDRIQINKEMVDLVISVSVHVHEIPPHYLSVVVDLHIRMEALFRIFNDTRFSDVFGMRLKILLDKQDPSTIKLILVNFTSIFGSRILPEDIGGKILDPNYTGKWYTKVGKFLYNHVHVELFITSQGDVGTRYGFHFEW